MAEPSFHFPVFTRVHSRVIIFWVGRSLLLTVNRRFITSSVGLGVEIDLEESLKI